MRSDEGTNRDDAAERAEAPRIEGLSAGAIAAFCDALEFDMYRHQHGPTAQELEVLRKALERLATEAHASSMQAERLLIGLKRAWVVTSHRDASPDALDPAWDLVVDYALDAFERTRPPG